jgi:hypothetical protein
VGILGLYFYDAVLFKIHVESGRHAIGRTIAKWIREVKYIDPIFPWHHIVITDTMGRRCYTNVFLTIPK